MKLYVFPQREIIALRMEEGTLRLIVSDDETEVTVEETSVTTLSNGYILANFLTQSERTQLSLESEKER